MNLSLSMIRTDGGTQARVQMDSTIVEEYAQAMIDGAVFPPVVVFHDGATYWLADGFHRVEAARQAGIGEIPVDVRAGNQRDAVLFAAGANATHGVRRTNADKRAAVLKLLQDEEWSQLGDREIARHCAVTHPFVGKLRAELVTVTTAAEVSAAEPNQRDVRHPLEVWTESAQRIRYLAHEDIDATRAALNEWDVTSSALNGEERHFLVSMLLGEVDDEEPVIVAQHDASMAETTEWLNSLTHDDHETARDNVLGNRAWKHISSMPGDQTHNVKEFFRTYASWEPTALTLLTDEIESDDDVRKLAALCQEAEQWPGKADWILLLATRKVGRYLSRERAKWTRREVLLLLGEDVT